MAASVWKGSIVLSLVTIPVRLYAAARGNRVFLRQLHKVCHTRLRQPLFCPHCNRIVERSEVVKGYEYDDGQYVLVTDDEIKKIAPPSARQLEIRSFAKQSEIDPILFDSSYFSVPEDEGRKSYHLLVKALEDMKKVGVGKLAMHQRDYTVFVRPYNHGLTLHTMYFANEIREVQGYGAREDVKLNPKEVQLAEQLVHSLTEPFKIQSYHDEFQERLRALLDAKRQGATIAVAPVEQRPKVIDIMTALKKSLAATAAGNGKRVKPPVRARTQARSVHRKAG